MKYFCILVSTLTLILSACSAKQELSAHDAWARPTAKGETMAVYFLMHNHTETDDELIGVSSLLADIAEIHESKMENDVMQMNQIQSLPLASGDEYTFEPGGLHVMLINIKQEVKDGDEFELTFHFKHHADLTLTVQVTAEEDAGSGHSHP